MIRAIAIVDDKRGIARDGLIPWHIPEDRRYFRELTENGIVVMGRTTYEQFDQPLVNRRNIVLSHDDQPLRDGFELVTNVSSFLHDTAADVWIIGGAETYESLLQYCDELYITHVQGDFTCDKFFPEYEQSFSQRKYSVWRQSVDKTYQFAVYARIEKPVSH